MTSSLTVWTSTLTKLLETRVAHDICATREMCDYYDSISIANCSKEDASEKINSSFNKLVTMTMTDTTLHIVAIVPFFEDNAVNQIQLLFDTLSLVEHNISLHVIGLTNDLQALFNTQKSQNLTKEVLPLLTSLISTAQFSTSYTLVDNYAANGAHIAFSIDSLARYLALIQTTLMQDYYGILSPSLVSAHSRDNLSIGVASISFNKEAVSSQLVGMAFLASLDKVGINDKEIDAQRAAHEAEQILINISDRYPNLYNQAIIPLYKDKNTDEGHVASEASNILDRDLDSLKTEILQLLESSNFTFPEKEAILAMILGRDNGNIRGMQYQHEGKLLDDACENPINLYVEAYNNFCKGSSLLPVREDYDALKEYLWNEVTLEWEDSPENKKALNPLYHIKRLKQDIINTTSFIREKTDELDKMQESLKQRTEADLIRKKWRKPKGDFKIIQYKEQPLDEKYIPASDVVIRETIDLRKYFSPVKNQDNLGSCSSFAATSMYEAMMNQGLVEGQNEMSPAFLYYYSNIITGRPAGGSNFFEQLEILGNKGICHEDLYIYENISSLNAPTELAKEDASTHRVISAKQIPLIDEPDKSETLRRNHTLLTSALSEGYPIGISLKVYDNFGTDGAFILHPEDAPDCKEDGWHALVIVGYSEENNFYIVRNSWGKDFGEDGYCYIPMAYIDDPDYMNFACIITEISDTIINSQSEVPTVIANFAATESEIRIAAIRNAIAKERIELKNSQKLYAEYYRYYQRLILQLTMPKVQNHIRQEAELAQTINSINVDNAKKELEDSFVDKLHSYKRNLQRIMASLSIITIGLAISWYLCDSNLLGLFGIISGGLTALTFMGYKWWIRIKRNRLQEELDHLYIEAKQQHDKLKEMQIRFHVAGMWISRFYKISNELELVYDRLRSYIDTLREWQSDYSNPIKVNEIPDCLMFRELNCTNLLESFFNNNKKTILNSINLLKVFNEYNINTTDMGHARNVLYNNVKGAIENLLSQFKMSKYIMGESYEYIHPFNIQEEIKILTTLAQPTFKNRQINTVPSVRILMANVEYDELSQWESMIYRCFPFRPLLINIADTTILTILTIHPQSNELA